MNKTLFTVCAALLLAPTALFSQNILASSISSPFLGQYELTYVHQGRRAGSGVYVSALYQDDAASVAPADKSYERYVVSGGYALSLDFLKNHKIISLGYARIGVGIQGRYTWHSNEATDFVLDAAFGLRKTLSSGFFFDAEIEGVLPLYTSSGTLSQYYNSPQLRQSFIPSIMIGGSW